MKKNVVRLSYVIPLLFMVVMGGESRADTLPVEDEGSANWALSSFRLSSSSAPEAISIDGAFSNAPLDIRWFTGVNTWRTAISPAIFDDFPAVFGSGPSRDSGNARKGADVPSPRTMSFQHVVSPSAGYGAIRPSLIGGDGAAWKNTDVHAIQDSADWLFKLQFAKSVNEETTDQLPFLPVPEPATGGLFLLGLALGAVRCMAGQGKVKESM